MPKPSDGKRRGQQGGIEVLEALDILDALDILETLEALDTLDFLKNPFI